MHAQCTVGPKPLYQGGHRAAQNPGIQEVSQLSGELAKDPKTAVYTSSVLVAFLRPNRGDIITAIVNQCCITVRLL